MVVTVASPTESLDLVQKVVGQVHRLLVVVLVASERVPVRNS